MELHEDASVRPPKGIFVSFFGGFNYSWFADSSASGFGVYQRFQKRNKKEE